MPSLKWSSECDSSSFADRGAGLVVGGCLVGGPLWSFGLDFGCW